MATAFDSDAPTTQVFTSTDQMADRYAMIGKGTCMEPLFRDGACLVFDKNQTPEDGDTVIVWFRAERVKPRQPQCVFKRLVGGLPPFGFPFSVSRDSDCEPLVIVEMINPPRRFRIPASHILAVHKCIGVAESNGDGTARYHPQECDK